MNEDIRYGLCFKKRSSFETSFLMKFRTGQKEKFKKKKYFAIVKILFTFVPLNERFLKHAFFSLQFDFPEA